MNGATDDLKNLENEVLRFFTNVDAGTLREDLLEYFIIYVLNKHGELPVEFESMGERFYALLSFLKQVDTLKDKTL